MNSCVVPFGMGRLLSRIGAQAVQAGFNHATRITSHAMKKPLSPKREGLKQATRQRRSLRRRVRGCPARPRRATGTTTATDAIGAAHEVESLFSNHFGEPADAKKVRAFSVNPRWAPALARFRSRRAPMRPRYRRARRGLPAFLTAPLDRFENARLLCLCAVERRALRHSRRHPAARQPSTGPAAPLLDFEAFAGRALRLGDDDSKTMMRPRTRRRSGPLGRKRGEGQTCVCLRR